LAISFWLCPRHGNGPYSSFGFTFPYITVRGFIFSGEYNGFPSFMGRFSVLTIPLRVLLSDLGEGLLVYEGLQSIWTALYSSYLGQLSQFYHTLTLGSLLTSVILFPFILIGSKKLVEQYRLRFMQWINQWRVVQFIKGSNFYQLYRTIGA
jgi:hypothetical protein